ncbi:MAG: hypothetical protein KGJ90_02165 [Patescibacteria group bacterium]|nr:hypothetical protein [Patescibacteria group bacterium]
MDITLTIDGVEYDVTPKAPAVVDNPVDETVTESTPVEPQTTPDTPEVTA